MSHRSSTFRKLIGAWLPSLMLLVSVAAPVLERADLSHETTVESEHDPGTCPPAHDHTICTQIGADLSLPAAPTLVSHDHSVERLESPTRTPFLRAARFLEGHPSRGPPLA